MQENQNKNNSKFRFSLGMDFTFHHSHQRVNWTSLFVNAEFNQIENNVNIHDISRSGIYALVDAKVSYEINGFHNIASRASTINPLHRRNRNDRPLSKIKELNLRAQTDYFLYGWFEDEDDKSILKSTFIYQKLKRKRK